MNITQYKSGLISAHADTLAPGDTLKIDTNTVINNKFLTLSCILGEGELPNNAILRVGHGKEGYASNWLEITKDTVSVYQRFADVSCPLCRDHELNIRDFIKLTIDVSYNKATITLMTSTGMFQLKEVNWAGRNGTVFAEIENTEITNVEATWWCNDYSKPVYLFGDSYFTYFPARWTYHLINNGYTNHFMTGYPGMRAQRGAIDAKISFERGKPEMAVWCLGMNDPDVGGEINASWLEATKEFISLCKNNNIIPILSTIPSVPSRDNTPKTKWVKASGYRYIDFEKAVGADKNTAWYAGMLHEDKVHPDVLGAQALYMQAISDLPELMIK